MKNNNNYFLIGMAVILMLIQGHLKQKIGMLGDYFSHPEYEFFSTFSGMDLFDMFLHGILPIILISTAVKKILQEKKKKES